MEVAMPMSGSAIDCYEDMFKEITRKLYGEDGLPDLTQGDRGHQTSQQDRGLTPIDYDVDTPILKPEEHLTAFGLAALMQNGFPSPFQQHKPNPNYEDKWIISEDNITWTQSKIASYNPAQKLFRCSECDCVGYLPRVAEHWLGTHSNLRVFQCPQCPYESAWARCVRMHLTRQHNINTEEATDTLLKNNQVLQEVTRFLQRLKTRLEINCNNKIVQNSAQQQQQQTLDVDFQTSSIINNTNRHHVVVHHHQQQTTTTTTTTTVAASAAASAPTSGAPASIQDAPNTISTSKRYSCSYCPYATDRRDLFTRHENIHREEKPFQCYVCQKQFNRADHVKKHFLRMHREHAYDLNRIRRHPPKNASGMSYYQKYNNNGGGGISQDQQQQHSQLAVSSGLSVAGINSSSITIPNGFNAGGGGASHRATQPNQAKSKNGSAAVKGGNGSSNKKKGEKRFTCCYCSWSGVDNWCLKRHMNTHLKPFICGLCDYKAARSERLATHVLKVHNKRACGKCTFLADDSQQLATHQQEHHPMEQRNRSSTASTNHANASANVLRNTSFGGNSNNNNSSSETIGHNLGGLKHHELERTAAAAAATTMLLEGGGACNASSTTKQWKSSSSSSSSSHHHVPKQHGAARLFNYMEASDGSDIECDSSCGAEDMSHNHMTTTGHRIQSDFLEAGDVGRYSSVQQRDELQVAEEADSLVDESEELPLFVCETCGCEFEDDGSLESHQLTHKVALAATTAATSPAKKQKENVNPSGKSQKYKCKYCNQSYANQTLVISHMQMHSALNNNNNNSSYYEETHKQQQRSARKQNKPKKLASGTPYGLTPPTDDLIQSSKQSAKKKQFYCYKCNGKIIAKFNSETHYLLHNYWKHAKERQFKCEHCDQVFNHKYQVILHASKEHVRNKREDPLIAAPVGAEEQFALPPLLVPPIADFSPHPSVHKLGLFFDHTFHNSMQPLIIPTFPPN